MILKYKNIFLTFIFAFTFVLYLPLLKGFFVQDEWLLFPRLYSFESKDFIEVMLQFFRLEVGHYVPLTHVFSYLFFRMFHLNYLGYAFVAVTGHLLSILLFNKLVSKIFDEVKLSLIATMLFAVGAAGYQATTWPIASINTHGATVFALISLNYFIEYIRKPNRSKYIISIISLFVSLLFKEIAIALFGMYFVVLFFQKTKNKNRKLYLLMTAAIGSIYIIFRFALIFIPSTTVEVQLPTATQTKQQLIYNFASFPFKGLVQTVIPEKVLWPLSKKITVVFPQKLRGEVATFQYDNFAYKRVLEIVNFLIAGILLTVSYKLYKQTKNKKIKNALLFGLIFVGINSLIYSISPERTGIIPLIDSRNLYFLSIGSVVVVTALISQYFKKDLYLWTFVALLILVNVTILRSTLKELTVSSKERKYILETIKYTHPDLPQKVIIYTRSNTAYYGMPETEKILPFQSGFGQTLLVWYYETEKYPLEFYENKYLWDIKSQGYKQIGDRGFGYIRDFDLLSRTLEEYNLSEESVIAYDWDSNSFKLTEISQEIREKLRDAKKDK